MKSQKTKIAKTEIVTEVGRKVGIVIGKETVTVTEIANIVKIEKKIGNEKDVIGIEMLKGRNEIVKKNVKGKEKGRKSVNEKGKQCLLTLSASTVLLLLSCKFLWFYT